MFVILINGCDIMKPNFRIVENSKWDKEEEFIQDYIAGMSYKNLAKKYDLGLDTVSKRVRRLDLPRRRKYYPHKKQEPKDPSYIYTAPYDRGRVTIHKYLNGKNYYFGTYATYTIAKQVVTELKKCNWDKTQLPIIKKIKVH